MVKEVLIRQVTSENTWNMYVWTHLYTQMHHLISKPNFSQQQLRDTNQQQAARWMSCDKVLFFSPLPSVFCLPGTLIGSMQSNVTNWIILAPELEAADRRSRERRAQSGSHTKWTSLGWHHQFLLRISLGFYTPAFQGTSGTLSVRLGPFAHLADLRPALRWKGQRAPV